MKFSNLSKKNFKSFIFLFITFALFFCAGLVFYCDKENRNESSNNYDYTYTQKINNLAESVGFSAPLQSFYEYGGSPITVYNFLVVARFNGEAEKMTSQTTLDMGTPSTADDITLTHYELIDRMFNSTSEYSVKRYYQEISNGRLNLQTIFVIGETSLQLTQTRSECGNKDYNGGTGYDPNATHTFGGYTAKVSELIEYEILNQICGEATDFIEDYYPATSDFNNDNYIDSISILLLPDPYDTSINPDDPGEVVINWADLLWAHSNNVNLWAINTYGSSFTSLGYDCDIENFRYTYNFETIDAGKYMMERLDLFNPNPSGYPKNNTAVHELGHVLGWPDYYMYYGTGWPATDSEEDTRAVDGWDIMSYNHFGYPQYPLTYNRLKQDWLDEQNIVEIMANGEYSIKPTNYEKIAELESIEVENDDLPQNRVFAYKIQSTIYPEQSIWLEYRKQYEGSFENNDDAVASEGLIVYRVDEGFNAAAGYEDYLSAGNVGAVPYNVYVFRNQPVLPISQEYIKTRYSAPLNLDNSSMGDEALHTGVYTPLGERTFTACDITWQDYPSGLSQSQITSSQVSFPDSEIVIEITSINPTTHELIFQITWEELAPESTAILREDFVDSNLYDKLLDLAGKEQSETLFSNDLIEEESLDLSNGNYTSLEGFEQLYFYNLQVVNLANNQLNNIIQINNIANNNPNAKFILVGNRFVLSSLNLENELRNLKYIWGFQKQIFPHEQNYLSENYLINASVSFSYFWHDNYYSSFSSTNLSFFINDSLVSSSLNIQTLNCVTGTNTFVFNGTGEQNFSSTLSITLISATLSSEIQDIERKGEMPYVIINGTSETVTITRNPENISTDTVSDYFSVIWTIQLTSKPAVSVTIERLNYFRIIDTVSPEITILGEEQINILQGESIALPTKELQIDDSGEIDLDYTFISSPLGTETNYWTKTYYEIIFNSETETIEIIDTLTTLTGSEEEGLYAIGYQCFDGSGNSSEIVYRRVFITLSLIDTQAPNIALLGNEVIYLNKDAEFLDDGINVWDNFDADAQLTIIVNLYVKNDGEFDLIETNDVSGIYYFNFTPTICGEYLLSYQATDTSENESEIISRTIHVIHQPLSSLEIEPINYATQYKTGTSVEFQIDLSQYSSTDYNFDSIFIWYVNGIEVQRGTEKTLTYEFQTPGEYTVSVSVENLTELGIIEIVDGQAYTVIVVSSTVFEQYGIYIIAGGIILIVIFIVISVVINRRRKFYF